MREHGDGPRAFLAEPERRQVAVLLEGLLPGGPTNPGATDAGAAEYVARILSEDASTYYEIPNWQALYRAMLPALDAAARQRTGRALEDLAPGDVTALLGALASGALALTAAQASALLAPHGSNGGAAGWLGDVAAGRAAFPDAAAQKRFFGVLRGHCIEACFADRRWGGNRDNVMWQWYGYPTGPAVEFDRGRYDGVANPGPARAIAPSGNTNTALAESDRGATQSLPVPPALLDKARRAALG